MQYLGEQGWRSDESARLSPIGPGSTLGPGVICGLSLLLVFVLAPRGFSPGTPVFPSSKTNISKFQFDPEPEGRFVSPRLLGVPPC